MRKEDEYKIKIPVNDLAVGLYIDLELNWMNHPFTFSSFKINSEKDLKIIKNLKLKEVTVFPDRSDVMLIESSTPAVDAELLEEVSEEDAALEIALWKEKEAQREKARKVHKKRREISKKYYHTSAQIKQVTDDLKSRPANAIRDMDDIVNDLVSTFDGSTDMMTQLVNLGNDEHTDYNHTTNVTMMSLMLGAGEGLSSEEMHQLGTGALLHDVGKIELPGAVKNKISELTVPEQKLLQQHPLYGRKLIDRVRQLDDEILNIIDQHHEYLDGSGYPHKLENSQIDKLARIVAITNIYDNLCNPMDTSQSVSPKNALATLYHKFSQKLDHKLVERFIGILGVFPPGTVVKINDEQIGLVVSTDSRAALQPSVLIYNPEIPKEEAQIINLTDFNDLKITEALNPGDFPEEIHQYLGVQERLGYLAESLIQ